MMTPQHSLPASTLSACAQIRTNQELMDVMHEQRLKVLGADESAAPSSLPFNKVCAQVWWAWVV